MIFPEVVAALGKPEVLGLMRVKNEAEWIEGSIESQLGLRYEQGRGICDRVLVLDDHSTDETPHMVRSFGEKRTTLVESPFTGVNEGRDKRFLLEHAIAANPAWVVWIDGDEVLERAATRVLRAEFTTDAVALSMQVLYFWNEVTKVRVDGVYAGFRRYSAFRVRGQPTDKLFFPSSGGEADLHGGGNCPQGLKGQYMLSSARIKHYGYLHPEQRQKKFEFYNRIDPNNEAEDCYRHIIETPGARHAPGPTELVDYVEP